MAKISYQDIESRLRSVEDALEFTMKAFAVQKREGSAIVGGQDKVVTKSLLDVYREAKALDQVLSYVSEQAAGDEVV